MAAVILISAFVSVKAIIKDRRSSFSFLGNGSFDNLEYLKNVECPVLIIHGQDDKDVLVHHASALYENCNNKLSELTEQPRMTHNMFSFFDDFINPVNDFLVKCNVMGTGDIRDSK